MESVSRYIVDRMLLYELISIEDAKYYVYSIQLILEKTTCLVLILCASLFFNATFYVASFLLIFTAIRRYSDGIHCESTLGCFIASVCLSLSTVKVSEVFSDILICQGGGDIVNDFYHFDRHNKQPQYGFESGGIMLFKKKV